jgi:hypothetical protein
MDRMEQYSVRRVKQLLAESWEHSRIVRQLEGLSKKKKIQRLIEQFRSKRPGDYGGRSGSRVQRQKTSHRGLNEAMSGRRNEHAFEKL